MATLLTPDEDAELLRRLRTGDEQAFMTLVDKYGPSLLRVAMMYVSSRAVAEEVVADTWLAVVTGLERFEGRSTLQLRLDPARNNQHLGINWADDFALEARLTALSGP